MGLYKKLIEEHRASSLQNVLKKALDYHFINFTKLETLGEPFSIKDGTPMDDVAVRMKANSEVKLEIQAYINHLRRLKHFIKYLQKTNRVVEPTDPELKQVWDDILKDKGMINMLANKWAVHRSIDDPRNESDSLHLEVLLNLEGEMTMWGNGHLYLSIDNHEFYLFYYHPRVVKFIAWLFGKIRSDSGYPSKSPQAKNK